MSTEHGTYAGHRRHQRLGEESCEACREASAAQARDRRRKKREAAANAAPQAAWPARQPASDGEFDFLVLTAGSTSRWNVEVWSVQTATGERILVWGAVEGMQPGELFGRIRELVIASRSEGHPITVIVVEKAMIRDYLGKTPGFREFSQDVRFVYVESLDRSDEGIMRALFAEAYREGGKSLPAVGPEYLEVKRRQLDEGRGVDHLLADFLGELNLRLILHAAGLPTRREIEKERERPDPQPMRRRPNPDAYRRGVVKRGQMLDVGRYERPEPVYEPIPQGHPALSSAEWVGTILPPKRGRRR